MTRSRRIVAGLAFGAHVLGFAGPGVAARWPPTVAGRGCPAPVAGTSSPAEIAPEVRPIPYAAQLAPVHTPRLDEDVLQHVDAVADETVDAEVEQPMHLGGIVDGPHVDLLAVVVRHVDESPCHDTDLATLDRVRRGHLEHVGGSADEPGDPGGRGP